MIFIRCPGPSPGGVWQQGHLPGVLDRRGHLTLVLGAVPAHPAGTDLAPVGDELPEHRDVLVVDVGDLLLAEHAELLPLLLLPALFLFLLALSSNLRHGYTGASSCGPPTPTETFSAQSPWPAARPCFSSLAVAHFKLGPISSASISILDRFSPSGVSQLFVRSLPTTTTRAPWVNVSATFSASWRHAVTSKKEVSASFHWPDASSLNRRLTATPNFTNAAPFGVYLSSGSRVRLPTMTIWFSVAIFTTTLYSIHLPADGQPEGGKVPRPSVGPHVRHRRGFLGVWRLDLRLLLCRHGRRGGVLPRRGDVLHGGGSGPALRRGTRRLRSDPRGGLRLRRANHDLEPDDLVREGQHPLELFQGSGIGVQVEHQVHTLGGLVDRVGEPPLPPSVHVDDPASAGAELLRDAVGDT